MNKFTYCRIKFLPNVVTGEFVNVAIVVGSNETGEWKRKLIKTDEQCQLFTSVVSSSSELWKHAKEALESFSEDEYSEEQLKYLHKNFYRGMIQYSAPLPAMAESVDEAMKSLLAVFDRQNNE